MDIDLLSKMVKELILDNDRVVLPGLGCFVAEIVPSTFSDKGYTINPPYRRLYFRSKPDQGDELARFYAASNDVALGIADRIITDFIADLKGVLHQKKTIIFPGLGRLRATKENNIFFVADEDLDIYPDGFGLEPISLKTNQETPQEVSAAVEELRSILDAPIPIPTPDEETSDPADQISDPADQTSDPADQTSDPAEETVEETTSPAEETVETVDDTVKPAEDQVENQAEDQVEATDETVAEEPAADALPQKSGSKAGKKVLWTILIVLLMAALLFGAFILVSRISPELLDPILYSKEELEIINYQL